MIDTVFSFLALLGSISFAACFVYAIKGNDLALFVCAFWLATLVADKVWATKEQGFLYGFLKGLIG
jgi:hypothetical protein